MKDSLIDLLLKLVEKTLAHVADRLSSQPVAVPVQVINRPDPKSIRVFTPGEQMKFSKASSQLIMRLIAWEVFIPEALELVLNEMFFSDSRFVNVDETKHIIRRAFARHLNESELAFLDLVLYQREDELLLN